MANVNNYLGTILEQFHFNSLICHIREAFCIANKRFSSTLGAPNQ